MVKNLLVIFILLLSIQPINNVLGSKPRTENVFINATALLEKNKDLIYPSNLEYLDKRTPIQLDYNATVKKYINFYVVSKPNITASVVGRGEYYFPIFEEILAKHNLPMELKNLAVIESGLNANAVSKSGAVGLWQFLFHTSKMFDLKIDSYVDERKDPVLSTEAACEFLGYLYRIFNDWQLAITAYNCGPGMIEKAIEEAGGSTDYWVIRKHLSLEAQNYYPKFVAACYATAFHKSHGINGNKFNFSSKDIQTVELKQSVWFKQIAKVIDVNEADLRLLNPVYKQDYVPVYDGTVKLVLPKYAVRAFHDKENAIYALKLEAKDYNEIRAEAGNNSGMVKHIHYVRGGEYFHAIAMKYNCTLYDIMQWNNMDTKYLRAGQALIVYVNTDDAPKSLAQLKVAEVPQMLFVDNN